MPYIKVKDRLKFASLLGAIDITKIDTKGELEYIIFYIMKHYMRDKDYRYSTLHDCTYAVQHCSDEFRRRFLDTRENEALSENGDV